MSCLGVSWDGRRILYTQYEANVVQERSTGLHEEHTYGAGWENNELLFFQDLGGFCPFKNCYVESQDTDATTYLWPPIAKHNLFRQK